MPALSILLSVYAYSLGPASLVAAVLATRPLFVFVGVNDTVAGAVAAAGRIADAAGAGGEGRFHRDDSGRRERAEPGMTAGCAFYVYDARKWG